MKANKKHLINQIESILADDIAEMQEVDVTSEKLIKLIWPLFEYYEVENKELKNRNKELQSKLNIIYAKVDKIHCNLINK
ncbi:MAG: hypothetical protein IIC75_00270 [Bacteroidetes bacterium]|nr:hypothetical protein [Bacteroidota bacterium]